MYGSKLFHDYLDRLCRIPSSEALKTGKVYFFVKDRPTASDEADTVMFAAIIYQGEAQHVLYVLDTLVKLENSRERQICASTDTGLAIETYALRHRPENAVFRAVDIDKSIWEIDKDILVDIRKDALKAVSHGVRHFRLIFGDKLEFRSGDAGDLGFVSVKVTMELLRKIAASL